MMNELDINVLILKKLIILNCGFSTKVTCSYLLQENMKDLSKLILENQLYLPHHWSDKDCKGTVVNLSLPSLHRGSRKLSLQLFKWD